MPGHQVQTEQGNQKNKKGRAELLVGFLEERSKSAIAVVIVLTLVLIIPMLTVPPHEQASQDPPGETIDLQREIDERFQPTVHRVPIVVESRSGDILTQAALWELYQNTEKLRQTDERGELAPEGLPARPYLISAIDAATGESIIGVTSIANAVQQTFLNSPLIGVTLENANDDLVKQAIYFLLNDPETSALGNLLSIDASQESKTVYGRVIDYWTSPAFVVNVFADNEKLGGGAFKIGVGGGDAVLNKEEFNRNVQEVLRGDQENYRLWGIAIDANLESEDEGQTAGMFIMFTVVGAVLIVGLGLRSYWAAALTGTGLGVLMIWLSGLSNLAGIKGGLVIDLIVPIAMVSLGIDFAVHAVRRYQEEKRLGYEPRRALRVGLAGVLGALVLAILSDGIAFLSNVSSNIEQVIHFGVAASIAVGASFVVFGLILPLVMMEIDQMRMHRQLFSSKTTSLLSIVGIVSVALLSGAGVIFLVAVDAAIGLAIIFGTLLGMVVLPAWITYQFGVPHQDESNGFDSVGDISGHRVDLSRVIEVSVSRLSRYAPLVLVTVTIVTAAAVVLVQRLGPTFDVKDFFDNESDFVISLDKADEHIGTREGEPANVYIKGDLTDHQALLAIRSFLEKSEENPYLAKSADEHLFTGTTVLDLLRQVTVNEYARNQIRQAAMLEITDLDGDGLPDSNPQLEAAYAYIMKEGIPLDKATTLFSAGQVREALFHDPDVKGEDVTVLKVGIPGSREQTTVAAAEAVLRHDLGILSEVPSITRVGLTGSPLVRDAQLEATTQTLQKSLPISAVAIFLLLLVVFRSLRYAIVTIIPIGLVVAWLYGFMYIAGFSLNFVTATIGAVSIGVGIDYSIHMTERFREELSRASDKTQALRRAASGTGVALVASAASSILGFAIMSFAPMPLFASYGILTAVMIFFALVASLFVLPSMLLFVTRR